MVLPNIGITSTMVASKIGAASRKWSVLCTHPNINKWSKYKPVILPNVEPDRSSNWWRSTNGNCGLTIPTYNSISALISGVDANGNDWVYQPPTGGANAPYRIADFGSYEHNARAPFTPNTPASQYYKGTTSAPISMNMTGSNQYELTLADIGNASNLGNMYFGVAVYQGGAYKHLSEVDTITTANGGGVEIPISGFTYGTYNIYMLASSVKKTAFDSNATGTFIPIPGGKFTIEILNVYKVRLYITGEITTGTKNVLNFTVTLENNDTVQHTRSGITVGWRYGDNTLSSPSETGEGSETISTLTAAPNSSKTVSFSKMGALPSFTTRGGYFYLQCTSHPESNISNQYINSTN